LLPILSILLDNGLETRGFILADFQSLKLTILPNNNLGFVPLKPETDATSYDRNGRAHRDQ